MKVCRYNMHNKGVYNYSTLIDAEVWLFISNSVIGEKRHCYIKFVYVIDMKWKS